MSTPVLWHYTCDHGRWALGVAGVLRPIRQHSPESASLLPAPMADVVWLTDLDVPHAAALGLTSRVLACDRTRHRYAAGRLDHPQVARYVDVRRALFTAGQRRDLEQAPGAMPSHWWVSTVPVAVTLAEPAVP